MARGDIKMPDEFLQKISNLGDKTEEIIPKVLKAGADVVFPRVRANLSAVIGKDLKGKRRSTGELVSALGVTPTKIDKDGNFNVKIGFSEPRSDGESNAKLANILEYGKSGQPAKPFLKPAKSAAKQPCIEAMKQKLEQELNSI
jgi:HK97 gp10 family phage protein